MEFYIYIESCGLIEKYKIYFSLTLISEFAFLTPLCLMPFSLLHKTSVALKI